MGSWGPGLQANDTALDYLDEEALNKTEAALKKIHRHSRDFRAVLGVADYLLDRCVRLPKKSSILTRALKDAQSEIQNWVEPKEREQALINFERRWQGKKVNGVDIAIDNLGLFDRMGRSNKQIRYLMHKQHVK